MTLSITEDIRSITDLKRNTNSVLDQIHKTKRPVVLTVNGKAEAVILDAKEYEKITHAFKMSFRERILTTLDHREPDSRGDARIVTAIDDNSHPTLEKSTN